jgi:hypothetical protein
MIAYGPGYGLAGPGHGLGRPWSQGMHACMHSGFLAPLPHLQVLCPGVVRHDAGLPCHVWVRLDGVAGSHVRAVVGVGVEVDVDLLVGDVHQLRGAVAELVEVQALILSCGQEAEAAAVLNLSDRG